MSLPRPRIARRYTNGWQRPELEASGLADGKDVNLVSAKIRDQGERMVGCAFFAKPDLFARSVYNEVDLVIVSHAFQNVLIITEESLSVISHTGELIQHRTVNGPESLCKRQVNPQSIAKKLKKETKEVH